MLQTQSKVDRTPWAFWALGITLIIYVAACTGFRDNKADADAWEHHRALSALVRDFHHPGNPTYATDLPSVRYSPYLVGWAAICRATHLDPYRTLSFAAVCNTVLLVLGVWSLLRAFGERRAAGAVLIVMVSLYGGAPGYANSYALTDLPWQQVNPSALSFALTLSLWSIFQRRCGQVGAGAFIAMALLAAVALLDHAMTGAFGLMGLFVLAAINPTGRRRAAFLAFAITLTAGLLCLAWPWYSFRAAVFHRQDNDYWFNGAILHVALTQWCVPAAIAALCALPLCRQPLARFALIGGALSLAAGGLAIVARSPVLARFPLPGMIFLHIAAGLAYDHAGIFKLSTWPARFRSLVRDNSLAGVATLQTVLAIGLIYFLAPQLTEIPNQPHLARAYLAGMLHHRDLQRHPRLIFSELLASVAADDVVLSDIDTSWLIPSFRGKIVAALHYELFVSDQGARTAAVRAFFSSATDVDRKRILRDYGVKWIVLNPESLDRSTFAALLKEDAVVRRCDGLVLIDAGRWLASGV